MPRMHALERAGFGLLVGAQVSPARLLDVPEALDVLGHDDAVLTLSTLRRWDPGARSVTET